MKTMYYKEHSDGSALELRAWALPVGGDVFSVWARTGCEEGDSDARVGLSRIEARELAEALDSTNIEYLVQGQFNRGRWMAVGHPYPTLEAAELALRWLESEVTYPVRMMRRRVSEWVLEHD